MGLKESYEQKLQAQLDEWSAKIDNLKAKADKAEADAHLEYYKEIEELRSMQDEASKKIEELKKDYPILGAEEFKECKNPEDYLEKLNNEFEKLNKESSQKKKCTTSLHR